MKINLFMNIYRRNCIVIVNKLRPKLPKGRPNYGSYNLYITPYIYTTTYTTFNLNMYNIFYCFNKVACVIVPR